MYSKKQKLLYVAKVLLILTIVATVVIGIIIGADDFWDWVTAFIIFACGGMPLFIISVVAALVGIHYSLSKTRMLVLVTFMGVLGALISNGVMWVLFSWPFEVVSVITVAVWFPLVTWIVLRRQGY